MPRFKTHLVIGAATGSTYSLAIQAYRQSLNPNLPQEINPVHVAVCSLAAAIGGCVPDAFEPADRKTGPNHRGKLHSFAVGAVGIKGAHFLAVCETGSVNERWLADIAGAFYAGYVSHLAADALTPKGLNLVCKGC